MKLYLVKTIKKTQTPNTKRKYSASIPKTRDRSGLPGAPITPRQSAWAVSNVQIYGVCIMTGQPRRTTSNTPAADYHTLSVH